MEALVEVDESDGTKWFSFCPFFKKQQLEGGWHLRNPAIYKGQECLPLRSLQARTGCVVVFHAWQNVLA